MPLVMCILQGDFVYSVLYLAKSHQAESDELEECHSFLATPRCICYSSEGASEINSQSKPQAKAREIYLGELTLLQYIRNNTMTK